MDRILSGLTTFHSYGINLSSQLGSPSLSFFANLCILLQLVLYILLLLLIVSLLGFLIFVILILIICLVWGLVLQVGLLWSLICRRLGPWARVKIRRTSLQVAPIPLRTLACVPSTFSRHFYQHNPPPPPYEYFV